MDGATTALSELLPAAGMACAVGAALGDQGRGAAGGAARGRGAPPTGRPTPDRLGRPRGAGRTFAATAALGLAGTVSPADHAPAMASRPGAAPLGLPPPAWPSHRNGRAPPAGPADGHREPDLGLPPCPRRAVPSRLQDRG